MIKSRISTAESSNPPGLPLKSIMIFSTSRLLKEDNSDLISLIEFLENLFNLIYAVCGLISPE